MALSEAFYVLRISLDRVRPEIWRRVRISSELPLAGVHVVFQVAMGWEARHLYSFSFGDQRYAASPLYDDDDYDPLDHVTLTKLVTKGDRFTYHYDFGDDWRHTVVVEEVGIPAPASQPVLCLGGDSACPPEDCGGPPGFEAVRAEGEFDAESFDLEEINMDLTEIFGLPDYTRYDFIDENDQPLPHCYNANEPLEELAWRKMNAEEQLWAVAAFHHWLTPDDNHPAVDIMRTHAIAHATIELQIATGQPAEVGEAMDRLISQNHSRHQSIHAISDVMEELMETRLALFDVMPNGGGRESAEEKFEEAIEDDDSEYNVALAKRLSMLGTDRSPSRN